MPRDGGGLTAILAILVDFKVYQHFFAVSFPVKYFLFSHRTTIIGNIVTCQYSRARDFKGQTVREEYRRVTFLPFSLWQ